MEAQKLVLVTKIVIFMSSNMAYCYDVTKLKCLKNIFILGTIL